MPEATATTSKLTRRRLIERPRLLRLLDESPERIKLLVAPAGYGKTTLARQWLSRRTCVWYRATDASRDAAALAVGVQKAAATLCPGAGDAMLQRLKATADPPADAVLLAGMLAADLQDWPQTGWLAIDDYEALAEAQASERFLETLIAESSANFMLLARRRPAWASSRRILYGDLFELNRAGLAMTADEAMELLKRSRKETASFLELSRGWPAVLGLAAASGAKPPDLLKAPQLFDFFADEVLSRIDGAARTTLSMLALYDTEGRHLALRELPRGEREHLLNVGVDLGALSNDESGRLEMHPLLRAFLEKKLKTEQPDEARKAVGRAAERLMDTQLWDEAYALISRFQQRDLLPRLIEAATPELLASGRVQTLRTWTEGAPETPGVQLANAELALRAGRHYEAEALAHLASRSDARQLAASALLVAGRAAHVASREREAHEYYSRALERAPSSDAAIKAELGLLQTGLELEDEGVHALLAALEGRDIIEPELQVVLADRKLGIETRFCLPVDLAAGRRARQLLPLVRDPMVRTSFRNVFGYTLAAMFHFDEARALTDEQIADSERCRLEFVTPYALTVRALVEIGTRRYLEAEETLNEVARWATVVGDQSAANIVAPIRARLYVSQGAFDQACSMPPTLVPPVTDSLVAEYEACRALALAGLGEHDQAERLASRARSASVSAEAQICAHAALAVVALRRGDHGLGMSHAHSALERASTSKLIECLACALRGFPDLTVCLLESPEAHDDLRRILKAAGVSHDGLTKSTSGSVFALSPREREVLVLVAKGMTNPAIGEALFISPVTVKVHVRHIFEKLGVKSRAEAALRAGQLLQ